MPSNAKPYVKKLVLCRNHDYLTFAVHCECHESFEFVRYAVHGTGYVYLRNTSGGIRFWNTYSGAYKAMKKYIKSRETT